MSNPFGTSPCSVAGPVAVQPLADQRRAVARVLQPRRQGVAAALHAVPAIGIEVPGDAVVVGVLAGDERGPRRAAERKRVDRVCEGGSLRRQQLPGLRHQREVGRGHVVGHHDEDVGPLALARIGRPRLRRGGEAGGRGNGQGERDADRRGPRPPRSRPPDPPLPVAQPHGAHRNMMCHTMSTCRPPGHGHRPRDPRAGPRTDHRGRDRARPRALLRRAQRRRADGQGRDRSDPLLSPLRRPRRPADPRQPQAAAGDVRGAGRRSRSSQATPRVPGTPPAPRSSSASPRIAAMARCCGRSRRRRRETRGSRRATRRSGPLRRARRRGAQGARAPVARGSGRDGGRAGPPQRESYPRRPWREPRISEKAAVQTLAEIWDAVIRVRRSATPRSTARGWRSRRARRQLRPQLARGRSWPIPGIITSRASGIAAATERPAAGRTSGRGSRG